MTPLYLKPEERSAPEYERRFSSAVSGYPRSVIDCITDQGAWNDKFLAALFGYGLTMVPQERYVANENETSWYPKGKPLVAPRPVPSGTYTWGEDTFIVWDTSSDSLDQEKLERDAAHWQALVSQARTSAVTLSCGQMNTIDTETGMYLPPTYWECSTGGVYSRRPGTPEAALAAALCRWHGHSKLDKYGLPIPGTSF